MTMCHSHCRALMCEKSLALPRFWAICISERGCWKDATRGSVSRTQSYHHGTSPPRKKKRPSLCSPIIGRSSEKWLRFALALLSKMSKIVRHGDYSSHGRGSLAHTTAAPAAGCAPVLHIIRFVNHAQSPAQRHVWRTPVTGLES